MKHLIAALLLLAFTLPARAQETETLLSAPVEHGGYGALVLKGSPVGGNMEMLVGAYGGWLINHQLMLGAGGYGLTTEARASQEAQDAYGIAGAPLYLAFDYGGFVTEYTCSPTKLVHATAQLLIGGGAVTYRESYSNHGFDDYNDYHYGPTETVFVLEPSIAIEANITTWFRVSAGGGYRYVSGVETLRGIGNGDLSGFSGNLALKFGAF
jgi:hypothetical protein